MRIILTLFLTIDSFFCFSQNIKGTWIGEYRISIQKNDETYDLENNEWITKKLDTVLVDTSYYSSNLIIDIIDDSHIKLCCLKGKSRSAEYTLSNDTIKFVIDTTSYELHYNKNELLMIDLDSEWQTSTVIMKRMNPLSMSSLNINENNKLVNSCWKFETDTLSINYGIKFHVLDSGQMVLTQVRDNKWGGSSLARCGFVENEDYTFFWFFDEYNLDSRVFRTYKKTTNGYLAQTFENQFNNEKPFIKRDVSLIQTSLPTTKELKKIENKLIGTWNLNGFSSLFEIDNWIKTYPDNDNFHLIFYKNKTFEINYSAEYTKKSNGSESQLIKLTKAKNGTWELGKSGGYIVLNTTTQSLREEEFQINMYVALVDLGKNNLTIGIDLEGPEDITYTSHVIRLKKGANKGEHP